jgi:uncharacterized protein YecE (DUF72 family)
MMPTSKNLSIEATQPVLESTRTRHSAHSTENIFLGTSSWSFPGWSMVFAKEYREAQLAKAGLQAYAQHPLLNAVGLDRSFYAPLSVAQYSAYAADVGSNFRFLVKAPDLVTGAQRRDEKGKPLEWNIYHLDAKLAIDQYVAPALEGLKDKLGCLVFQFSPLPRAWLADKAKWIERLEKFLQHLPTLPTSACYAVEIRDAALLTPRLMKALAATNTTYCLGLHDRLPHLDRQLAAWDLLKSLRPNTANPLMCRWTLRQGMTYQSARERFSPFTQIHFEDNQTMKTLAQRIRAQQAIGEVSLVIINNKAEGCAPISVQRLDAAIAATENPTQSSAASN